MTQQDNRHHVVIVGGGFGGLYAARELRRTPLRVTLVDKRNFHLFQPLLYQVATGGLSPGDICYPLRAALEDDKNVCVLKDEVTDILPDQHKIILRYGDLKYDSLIVATGLQNYYFGHDAWAESAPGLKTLEDGLEIRRRILTAFERAERMADSDLQQACLTFVIVGGGPTGVELAGAIAELSRHTLKGEFRSIDPAKARIILIEGTDRILPTFSPSLSAKAERSLDGLGVIVRTNTLVTDVQNGTVTLRAEEVEEQILSCAVLWAAGMRASPLGRTLAEWAGAELDRTGRVLVAPDLSVPGHPEILVVGDLAHFVQEGRPLPGVAPVAMQQGRYAARLIKARLKGDDLPPFHYRDKGSLAVIGRNAAVAQVGDLRFSGFLAWILWVFIHIGYLIGFDNKLIVMFQWGWNYLTRRRGARLITEGPNPY
jgi:NADH dehydrogenase